MTRARLIPLAALIILLLILPPAPTASAAGSFGTLAFDGAARTYYLHVPDDLDDSAPVPLLVALHARASSGYTMALLTGLDAAADETGMIAVFPDTLATSWGEDYTVEDGPDDVGFIVALIEHLGESYNIDPARIYLAGFANGGLMVYRLACEVPELFAGAAVVGPTLFGYHVADCPAEVNAPLDMLVVHGDADDFYHTETYTVTTPFSQITYTVLGDDDTLAYWAARDGCDLDAVTDETQTRVYTACDGDTRVALYRLFGGKQIWSRAGDYALNPFGVDMTEIVLGFLLGDDDWAAPQPEPYPAAREARTWVAYVPPNYDPAEAMPVVVLLHGRFGSGAGTATYTGLNRIAAENGFIGVYPDGLLAQEPANQFDTGWNYFRGVPGFPEDSGADDAAFIATLLDDLALDLNIDTSRVYVTGISNGGFMVQHLACMDPARYAAFASVAGEGYYGIGQVCLHDVPVPMLIIHGTADNNILWNGNTTTYNGQEVYLTLPVTDTLFFWGLHNDCDMEDYERVDLPQGGESPGTEVRIIRLLNCQPGTDVALYGIVGGGHNWPGIPDDDPAQLVNLDINAGEVIWEFFAAHVRDFVPIEQMNDEADESAPAPDATEESAPDTAAPTVEPDTSGTTEE
ncbi:MAG: hypothetical protein JW910_12035 [Anaerolineae bacterium]|nr:hypothetical protein [Anaerolineae bacterium]